MTDVLLSGRAGGDNDPSVGAPSEVELLLRSNDPRRDDVVWS